MIDWIPTDNGFTATVDGRLLVVVPSEADAHYKWVGLIDGRVCYRAQKVATVKRNLLKQLPKVPKTDIEGAVLAGWLADSNKR